jgi:chemotaxis response regulator CheB
MLYEQLPPDSIRRQIEVVGVVSSAGGLQAVSAVLRSLPADFPATVLVCR